MIKEYINFIKEYIKVASIKTKYILINILSAFFYKGFEICLPLIAAQMIKYLTLGNDHMTYLYLGVFIVLYLLYNISLYINYKIYGYNMNYCYDQLTKKILNKLSNIDNSFHKNISKGRIINTINSDIINIGDMNDRISEVVIGIIQILAVLVIVGFYSPFLSFLFIVFAYLFITIQNSQDRKVNLYHDKVVIQDDKYSNLLTQIISGLQEIKTFNMLSKLKNKLGIIQRKFVKDYTKKRFHVTVRDNDVNVVVYVFRAILYTILIYFIFQEKIGINILVLIVSYHEELVTYINEFIDSTAAIRETNTSVGRINDLLNCKSNELAFGSLETDDIYGAIEMKNVSLSLNHKEVLKNINLKIDHSKVVAIVGEAGCGKTMLFNLLLRIYQPTKGKITLDNTDIYEFSREVYTKNIGVVNQKPFIFNMSIRKNLDFVDPNIKNQIEACKRAGIHEFIESLPNGYRTKLRENGSNISGGQKQMISIARTILTDCEVLLLDDITTSLDPDTAKLVPKLIKNLKKDHTIIMITKKPDLMKIADEIAVMDQGKIVQVGTHQQLMKTNEIYQMLQSRKSPSRIGVFDHD